MVTSPDRGGKEADADDLTAGTPVGEYRVERVLGRGGMGAVYAAHQPEIGARVAIKVLAADLSRDPRVVRRFIDEARAANKIRHPNIIDIFAFGHLPDGRAYFVMEHLDGETWAARLARGPLPATDARTLLLQVCEGLEAAHQEGIVHRDLKPENLWMATPRHARPYAKILDFGIAKLIEARDALHATTEEGVIMGTPYYMSPEQCRGGAIDARSDVYAVGVLLYFMWTSRLPFEGTSFLAVATAQITTAPTPPSQHRAVPPRLERLILRCLEKDPARRPQSARALATELDEALQDLMPGETLAAVDLAATVTPAPPPAVSIAARSQRGLVIVIASAGVLVAVALALLFGRGRSAPPASEAVLPSAPSVSPTQRRPPSVEPGTSVEPVLAAPAHAAAPASPHRAHLRGSTPPGPSSRAPAPASDTLARPDWTTPSAAPSRVEERGFVKENPFR